MKRYHMNHISRVWLFVALFWSFDSSAVVSQVRAIRLQRSQTVAFIIQTTNGNNFLHFDIIVGSSIHYATPYASAILTTLAAATEGFTQKGEVFLSPLE